MSVPALQLDRIVRLAGGRTIVDGVSLSAAEGEVVCLLGPSGCGKSTTLRVAAGLERPEAGEVRVAGVLVDGQQTFVPPEKRGVGLVFQDLALFPHLTVMGNASFGLAGLPRPERDARARELLSRVGLAGREREYPATLSGGEQQRLAVVRALAPRPRVMLLDEPFSGLDDRLRDSIRADILGLLRRSRTATLFVTHDPTEALRAADRIALMRAGRIVQIGTPAALIDTPADADAAAFFGPVNRLVVTPVGDAAESPWGRLSVPAALRSGPVEVVIREGDLQIEPQPGGPATIREVQRSASGVRVLLEAGGVELAAELPPGARVTAGERAVLSAAPDRVMYFPAAA